MHGCMDGLFCLNKPAWIGSHRVVFQGTDSTMLYKINKEHKGNKSYVSSKNEHDSRFGIQHFAGVVFYDSNGIHHIPSLN